MMQNTKNRVAYEKSTYTSIFNIEAIDERFENDIYEALKELRYADGRHYIRKQGNKICRIEFIVDDDYYVGDEFGEKHAKEIAKVLARLASNFGTTNALLA